MRGPWHSIFRTGTALVLAVFIFAGSPAYAQGPQGKPPERISGKLSVIAEDEFVQGRVTYHYRVLDELTQQWIPVNIPEHAVSRIRGAGRVTLHGTFDESGIFAADGAEPQATSSTNADAITHGEQRVLVMTTHLRDKQLECTNDQIRNTVFDDPYGQSVAALIREASHGKTWLTGDISGTHSIGYTYQSCDIEEWSQALDAAARADGFEPLDYDRRIYVMPGSACSGVGLGSMFDTPTRAWIMRCDFADVYAHELGHNMGLGHAGTPGVGYGDLTDFMGTASNELKQNNAPNREVLGWLGAEDVHTVTAAGDYTIAPLETTGGEHPTVLKVPKADDSGDLYLSYRTPVGFDANLSRVSELYHLAVHEFNQWDTLRLAQIPAGNSYTAPDGTLVRLHHADDLSATLEVRPAGEPTTCRTAEPDITVTPVSVQLDAGQSGQFAWKIVNRDSGSCADRAFTVRASSTTLAVSTNRSSATIAAGGTATGTVSVATNISTAAGRHIATVDFVSGAQTWRRSATVDVQAACTETTPSLSLSPSSQQIAQGSSGRFTLQVVNRSTGACPSSTYDVAARPPAGWSADVSPSVVALEPGESSSVVVTLGVPADANAGTASTRIELQQRGSAVASTLANVTVPEPEPPSVDNPPREPGSLSVNMKRKHIALSWTTGADDIAVVGYEIRRNGVHVMTTPNLQWSDRNIQPGQSYHYDVRTIDSANQRSRGAASADIDTPSPRDRGPRSK